MTVSINSTAIIFDDSTSQNTAGVIVLVNSGTGANIYVSKSGSNAQCRIITSNTGSLTQTANVVTLTIA